jgi:hypothetical protein
MAAWSSDTSRRWRYGGRGVPYTPISYYYRIHVMDGRLERTHIRTTATRHRAPCSCEPQVRLAKLSRSEGEESIMPAPARSMSCPTLCADRTTLVLTVRGCALPSDLRIELSYHSRWTVKEGAPEVGSLWLPLQVSFDQRLLCVSESKCNLAQE